MCLHSLSLTDKVSKMALYNFRITDPPSGDAAKVSKLFHSKNIDKMNELKGELVRSTLTTEETSPDEWFTELFFIRRCPEDYYKCTSFGDVDMMNQIIYNTNPAAY
jgi:hypothetical protein